MVYDKIKYVFRKDGQSGKKWIDNCLKFYKDNPEWAVTDIDYIELDDIVL